MTRRSSAPLTLAGALVAGLLLFGCGSTASNPADSTAQPSATQGTSTRSPAATATAGSSATSIAPGGPGGLIVLARSNELVVRDLATGDEQVIATTDGADFMKDPVWSSDGSKVAYDLQITLDPGAGSDYGSDLYIVDADGQNLRMLLQHDAPGTFYVSPSFSPDGGTLYFFSARQDDASGSINPVFELRSMALGSGQVTVVADKAYGGEVSNDGSKFVFVDLSTGNQQLTLLDLASGDRQVLVTPDDGLSFVYAPRFSPDDKRIVFAGSGDIGNIPTVMNPATPPAAHDGPLDVVGEWLFGDEARADGPPWDLYLVDTAGPPNLRRLTEVYDDQPVAAWSADGSHIVYIGITGLMYLDVAQKEEPVKLDEGLLHSQLDWDDRR